jgi:hypothetical protein
MSCFSFYLLCFSSTKLENRRAEQVLGVGRLAPVGWGGGRERGRRMNMVQTMYTHVCKCKSDAY